MESIEISAKSVEEAVELALAKLGLNRSEVEVVVVEEGKKGIFGFGSEEIKVRVTPLGQMSEGEVDVGGMAKGVLENLLSLMEVPASVNLEEKGVDELGAVSLDIRGENLGILIGRRGETLSTLQYLVNLIVSRGLKAHAGVFVDVEGYRQRRHQSLRLLARRMAEQVKSTGRSVALESMPPSERRIIHLELQDDSDVTTQSVGWGEDRKVAILSKEGSGGETA